MNIGFIGAGVVSSLLSKKLDAEFPVSSFYSLNRESCEGIASKLANCTIANNGQQVADASDIVFITTPEKVIKEVVDSINWNSNTAVVHCSGLTTIDVLDSAKAKGCDVAVAHILHNFNSTQLEGSTVTIETTDTLFDKLCDIFTKINCLPVRLQTSNRDLYHSSIPYTQDFINLMFAEAVSIWRECGIDQASAEVAVHHLLRTTDYSIQRAVDNETMERHVGALSSINKDKLYKMLKLHQVNDIDMRVWLQTGKKIKIQKS